MTSEHDDDFPDKPAPFWLICILAGITSAFIFVGLLSLFDILLGFIQ